MVCAAGCRVRRRSLLRRTASWAGGAAYDVPGSRNVKRCSSGHCAELVSLHLFKGFCRGSKMRGLSHSCLRHDGLEF